MPKFWFTTLIFAVWFISSPVSVTHAHGGHKKPPVETMKEDPAGDSIYAVEEDTETTSEETDGFSFSRTDPLGAEILPMDHDAMGSMDHKMPEVEIAKREWVSSEQKGYGVAVGITLFAGLVFGVLQFKRPNE
jgi:hypothetical protein